METDLKKIVGHRLQMLRMEKNLTQEQMGEKLNLSTSCLLYTSVDEVSKLLEKYIIPLFEAFEDIECNIEKLIDGDLINHNLLYYIYHFGGKAKAQQYFNKIIQKDKLKTRYIGFYNQLKDMPKENISLDKSEFYGSAMIKFAYLNGIEIEKIIIIKYFAYARGFYNIIIYKYNIISISS